MRSRRTAGYSLVIIILVILAVILALIAIGIPVFQSYKKKQDKIGCMSAMDSAKRQVIYEYINRGGDMTGQEAVGTAAYAMLGFTDLCPGGGTVYLIDETAKGGAYEITCGLHESDDCLRTRLNAGYVLGQIEDYVGNLKPAEEDEPDAIEVTLNGAKLTAEATDEDLSFKRGTATTMGYENKGTLVYYRLENYEVVYYCFVDEDHVAYWEKDTLWRGDCIE